MVARPLRWAAGPRRPRARRARGGGEALRRLPAHEPVLHRLVEAGREVGVEVVRPAPRQRRGARRQARVDVPSASNAARRDGAAALASTGRSAGASRRSSAAALGRAAGEPRRDDVGQGPGQRRARAARAGPRPAPRRPADDPADRSDDEDHDRRRRPLALDPLDQLRDLAAGERLEVHADRRPQAGVDDGEVLAQRVLAGEAVGLVGRGRARSAPRARSGRRTWRRRGSRRRRRGGPRSASTIGRSAARRPSQRSRASSARGWRRSGSARALVRGTATPRASSASAGTARRIGPASRRSRRDELLGRAARARSGRQRLDHGRPRRVHRAVRAPAEHQGRVGAGGDARRTPRRGTGWRRCRRCRRPARSRRDPSLADARAAAIRASCGSRPTNRRLTTLPGITAL